MEYKIGTNEIATVCDEIWSSMLNITLHPTENLPAISLDGIVTATIGISGAWEGVVRLDLSRKLARSATAILLGVTPEEVQPEEQRDTSGELANMIAGAVKSLLPSPSRLGLPSVIDGHDFCLTVQQGSLLLKTPFACNQGSLVVSIFAQERGTESGLVS